MKMPPEVVSEIFELCMPHRPANHNPHSDSKFDFSAPFILGAVCQQWRRIAWSTPRLWTTISMDLSTALSQLPLARGWLSRSGTLPLSVFVRARNKFSILSNADFGPLISFLNENAHRWQSLVLDLPVSTFSCLRGDPQGRSILKTLKFVPLVHPEAPSGVVRWTSCSNNFDHKPTVVDVAWMPFPFIGINWVNVTQAKVSGFSMDQVFELLRSAPSMIQCSVFSISANENHYPVPRYPIPSKFISHPNLEYLHLHLRVGETLPLSRLSLPPLSVLTLGWHGVLNAQDFISLIERSSPPLRVLTIANPTIRAGDFLQLLQAVPTITTLQLKMGKDYDTKALFRILSDSALVRSDEGHRQLLPKLEAFEYIGFQNFPWSAVPKLFGPISELGHPGRRPLSRLHIGCYCNTPHDGELVLINDRETVWKIQDLMGKGMKVEIEDIGYFVRDILGMSIELHK